MISRQCRRQALVVSRQPPEASRPAKRALHDPPPRQQHKSVLGLVMLYDFQVNALLGCGGRRFFAGIPLIDKSYFYLLLGHGLNRLRQLGDLRPVLFIGGSHPQRQQMTQSIDRGVNLRALAFLVSIESRSVTALRSGLKGPTRMALSLGP